ncbi:hypothetical protein [Paraburkholderia sp. ZP32-5]|uniref:hypothetical protein n=1 Tax=Paraburkholderia sp. ZP32-5 TaxID=2883245 RepID=UPI001F3EF4C7|nr:hypothetical protein [Paraburkholderia sp. ZP32-5]
MGDYNTSLVDTDVSREDAPKSALKLYERLVDGGVIRPELRDDLSLRGFAFPLRDDFRGLDDLEGWGSPERKVNSHSPEFTRIKAIEIDVTGHAWQIGADGRPELIAHSRNYGLFMNFEGGFRVNCPSCNVAVEIGAEGSEGLDDALNVWCEDPDSHSPLRCRSCHVAAPLSAWRSKDYEFAAGHLGMTLWGEHLLGLTERPFSAATKLLKGLFAGSDGVDPAVVFCNI